MALVIDQALFRRRLNAASMLYRAPVSRPIDPAGDTRSTELRPSGHMFLKMANSDGTEDLYRPTSFERTALIDELARQREAALEKSGLIAPTKVLMLAGGRVLECRLDHSDHDGLAGYHSRGLVDEFDVPGHDTWLMLARSEWGDTLLAWIPQAFLADAQAAIWANPTKCLGWWETH